MDKQQELGYIVSYHVYRPGLHASDRAAYRKDENSRWALVDAHHDLPIHEVDPHATE